MPLPAHNPLPPPPLNPIQDRLARGAPAPLSSHTVFHPATTSPHSLPSTSIRPSNLPPDSWRTHAIREKAARMLDDWELLATDALEREESMPQARHRWQKVLMKGEFLTVEEERGTDPRVGGSGGRRGVAHRIEKKEKGKSSSARAPIEGHNHPGWVDQVSKWGDKEEELVKRCQQERQMHEQRRESWKGRKAGAMGSGGAMDVDEEDEDSNATEQEVNGVPEVIEADSDFYDDDEVDGYGLQP